MRLVTGCALIAAAWPSVSRAASGEQTALAGLELAAGVFVLIGLWTPIIGAIVTILGFWRAATEPGDPWAKILLGTIGAALALLGPGAWSIDARLFGWKRIDVRSRTGQSSG